MLTHTLAFFFASGQSDTLKFEKVPSRVMSSDVIEKAFNRRRLRKLTNKEELLQDLAKLYDETTLNEFYRCIYSQIFRRKRREIEPNTGRIECGRKWPRLFTRIWQDGIYWQLHFEENLELRSRLDVMEI